MVSAFLELLNESAAIWRGHPVQFIIALLAGVLIGYFLSRLRYHSLIDVQKVHLAIKDEAIRTASASAPRADPPAPSLPIFATSPRSPAEETSAPQSSAEDPRFRDINLRIISDSEAKIHKAILGRRYKLVYNPETGKSKTVSFHEGGEVGEGRNDNESRWRISGGRLEFLDSAGIVYSRFFILPDGKTFHHTNDPDTRSIKGQYLQPLS
jgi:hypothetical protein